MIINKHVWILYCFFFFNFTFCWYLNRLIINHCYYNNYYFYWTYIVVFFKLIYYYYYYSSLTLSDIYFGCFVKYHVVNIPRNSNIWSHEIYLRNKISLFDFIYAWRMVMRYCCSSNSTKYPLKKNICFVFCCFFYIKL